MHLSLWFVTKFMTATTAAVNASVRNEKKNTSQGPALFRSGKQAPRRRQSSKRIPYSALFLSTHPAFELRGLYKVAGAGLGQQLCSVARDGKRGSQAQPKTTDLLPAWPPTRGGSMDSQRPARRLLASRGLCSPAVAAGRPREREAWAGREPTAPGCV